MPSDDEQFNIIEFRAWGRYALFTDPLTRIGGEKMSYHLPTYEALKGVAKSVYWKPTFVWRIDAVRVIKSVRTQTKGIKPLKYAGGGNDLSIYTYLADVEYQVRARFEWNEYRPDFAGDRNLAKHAEIAARALRRGGRQDVFLGTRDCQGYVEPCEFGSGKGDYDQAGEIAYGLMFHSFGYPDETGRPTLKKHFWRPVLKDGVLKFPSPAECPVTQDVRPMTPKRFPPKSAPDAAKENAEQEEAVT